LVPNILLDKLVYFPGEIIFVTIVLYDPAIREEEESVKINNDVNFLV